VSAQRWALDVERAAALRDVKYHRHAERQIVELEPQDHGLSFKWMQFTVCTEDHAAVVAPIERGDRARHSGVFEEYQRVQIVQQTDGSQLKIRQSNFRPPALQFSVF